MTIANARPIIASGAEPFEAIVAAASDLGGGDSRVSFRRRS